MRRPSRRRFLRTSGILAAGSVLAGCSGQSADSPTDGTTQAGTTPTTGAAADGTTAGAKFSHDAVRWAATVGESVTNDPVVAGGTVYVGSDAGRTTHDYDSDGHHLRALSASDGEERWAYETGTPVDTSPVVTEGTVYVVGGYDNGGGAEYEAFAVERDAGAERWARTYDGLSAKYSLLGATDGMAFVGSYTDLLDGSDSLIGVKEDDGAVVWKRTIGDTSEGSVVDETLHVVTPVGLYALDAGTGEDRWAVRGDGETSVENPLVAGDAVYYSHGGLVAADRRTGAVRWRHEFEGYRPSWYPGENAVFGSEYDRLVALSAEHGAVEWETDLDPPGRVRTVADGTVYVDTESGVAAFDAGSGEKRWEYAHAAETRVEPAANAVYLVDTKVGGVTCLSPDGEKRWGFYPDEHVLSFAVTPDGAYGGTDIGTLYAFD